MLDRVSWTNRGKHCGTTILILHSREMLHWNQISPIKTHHSLQLQLKTLFLGFQSADFILFLLLLYLELPLPPPLPLLLPLTLELPLCSLRRTHTGHWSVQRRLSAVQRMGERSHQKPWVQNLRPLTSFLSISLSRSSSLCRSISFCRSSLISSSLLLLSSISRASFSLFSRSSLSICARRSLSLLSASWSVWRLFSSSAFPLSRLALNLSSNDTKWREMTAFDQVSVGVRSMRSQI